MDLIVSSYVEIEPCVGWDGLAPVAQLYIGTPVCGDACGVEATAALDERVERLAAGGPDDVLSAGEDECAALRRQLDEAEGGGEERDAEVVRDGACRLEADR